MVNLLPYTEVYGGRLKDKAALLASSSGGAFVALSDVFLRNGDAIACSTYNFETQQQEFRIITDVLGRNQARGSKYMQSIPGDIFKEAELWLIHHPEKKLFFIGMGCQVAGFQKYAEMKGFLERVIVVDIICYGLPSPQIWREYAESLTKSKGRISALNFKDKRNGWKKPTAFAVIDNEEYSLREYVKVFYNRKELRLSCHKCPYTTTERYTDITIGDFWHIEDKIPNQYDKMGTSLFLVHTEKGKKLFEAAKPSLHWFESNTSDCWQTHLEKPTSMAAGREKFWEDYYTHGIDFVIQKYGNERFMDKVKRKARETLKFFGGGVTKLV